MSVGTSVGSESDREQWRAAVAAVLAKSSRKDPAELGDAPEHLLDSPTYEGFPIRPLYTILDSQPEAPLPGRWPYTRGSDGLRDVKSGWKVAETFPAPGQVSVTDGNGAVLAALTEGTSALILEVGPKGSAPTKPTGCSRVCSSNSCPWCSTRVPTTPPPPTRCWRW